MNTCTTEQIEGIQNANVAESPKALAARLGVTIDKVYYYRAKTKNKGATEPKAEKKKSPPSKRKATPEPEEQDEQPEAFEITATLTLERIDEWWKSLTYAEKANVLAASFDLGF